MVNSCSSSASFLFLFALQVDVLLVQDGQLLLLLRQLPLPLRPAGGCSSRARWSTPAPPPPASSSSSPCRWMFFSCKMVNSCSSSASFLFLFALQAWLALLFCSLILLYFSSSVNSAILTRLLLLAFVASSFTSSMRKLVVASSASLGKLKSVIWLSSMIHLSRSSVSLDSTLLPTTVTGSSILPSASIAGRQSPRLASSRLVQVEKVSTSTICSTSALCSVMWRVVVGRGSGSVKSNATFSIISIMFVESSDRGTVLFSIVRFSSSSIISIGAMLVLTKTVSSRRRSSKLIVLVMAVSSVVFSSTSPLKTLVSCFPVVSSPSTSLEVEMLKPSTPQTGVWRQDSCPCVIIVSCAGSFKHSVVSRESGFRLAEICSLRLPKLEIEFNEVLSGLIPLS